MPPETAGPGRESEDAPLAFGPVAPRPGGAMRLLQAPLFRLALYYLALMVVANLLIREFAVVERALVTPAVPVLAESAAVLTGEATASWNTAPEASVPTGERALTTLMVVLAAISLAFPVAWVYMLTKPLRYDPGLVRSVVLLPIAVAGILLVVKNSLAIAFSLAGIVAAVRFRNTLKDPRDAVYIFLTIAIGIAAGVQAVDVALVVSVVFNLVVFALWRFQVGALQSGRYGRTGVLSVGDGRLLVADSPDRCEAIRLRAIGAAKGIDPDGILLVHTGQPEVARHALGDALRQHTKEWRALEPVERGGGITTTEYLVELAKKSEPSDLLGVIDEWSARIDGAEFIPFQDRRTKRQEEEDREDDDED